MREATLNEILSAREERVAFQKRLLAQFGGGLICLTLNIPGPRKLTHKSGRVFRMAVDMVLAQLGAMGLKKVNCQLVNRITGSEGYFMVDLPAQTLKAAMIAIEDSMPVARLFDLDVLDRAGKKISREDMGLPGRKCLLCDAPAPVCARSRAHSLEELEQKTNTLMAEALDERDARAVAQSVVRSLLYEVCVSPKPGLVDRLDSGSHRDMDIFTFMSSAASLHPYFADCYKTGRETRSLSPRETFHRLRLPGIMAEQTMFRATGGINTHRGIIFSMGLICGALGRLDVEDRHCPETICRMCAAMTQGLTQRELREKEESSAATNGERVFQRYGVGGVRAQAEQGFPAVVNVGLPALEKGLSQGLSPEEAGRVALVALMAVCEDTNLISRGGIAAQREVSQRARAMMEQADLPDREALEIWNRELIEKNLSPGGCADLLALTYFLYFLRNTH